MMREKQVGFSLLETMASLAVLLVVGGIVMTGMTQLMKTQASVANRTDMHSSVRSATELLQQEIGQAGKISLGNPSADASLSAAVLTNPTTPTNFSVSASDGSTVTVYPNEVLWVDVGSNQEAVIVSTVNANGYSGTALFQLPHALGAPVVALGAFGTGVVPPAAAPASLQYGSSQTVLKLYGDINGDGNMVYVEYTCTQGTQANPGYLYRHQMPITAGSKTANDNTMILLNNVLTNPNDASNNPVPCFAYQVQPLGGGYCVTDVAVTLTVQTQNKDLQTNQFQRETKALLNVAPRNVVEVYDTASLVDPLRNQPMPATVANLLNP
jgi:type II secretory pathway pseudopilin PulG